MRMPPHSAPGAEAACMNQGRPAGANKKKGRRRRPEARLSIDYLRLTPCSRGLLRAGYPGGGARRISAEPAAQCSNVKSPLKNSTWSRADSRQRVFAPPMTSSPASGFLLCPTKRAALKGRAESLQGAEFQDNQQNH